MRSQQSTLLLGGGAGSIRERWREPGKAAEQLAPEAEADPEGA